MTLPRIETHRGTQQTACAKVIGRTKAGVMVRCHDAGAFVLVTRSATRENRRALCRGHALSAALARGISMPGAPTLFGER